MPLLLKTLSALKIENWDYRSSQNTYKNDKKNFDSAKYTTLLHNFNFNICIFLELEKFEIELI